MLPAVPRIAAIHDLAGLGHTSLMAVIPILSSMGIQVCPLPTAVLSTSTTGYEAFRFADLSTPMCEFLTHWQELGMRFDAVYSGFLGSPQQVAIVAQCIDSCLAQDGLAVVDPVLGDNGALEPTMTEEMVDRMRWLVGKASCVTPNLTEAALLLQEPCLPNIDSTKMSEGVLQEWLVRLAEYGPEIVVITSVPFAHMHGAVSAVIAYEKKTDMFWRVMYDMLPGSYPGTGDTFTSVLMGNLLQKVSLPVAIQRAAHFVSLGIRLAVERNSPERDGICLEIALPSLMSAQVDSPVDMCAWKKVV